MEDKDRYFETFQQRILNKWVNYVEKDIMNLRDKSRLEYTSFSFIMLNFFMKTLDLNDVFIAESDPKKDYVELKANYHQDLFDQFKFYFMRYRDSPVERYFSEAVSDIKYDYLKKISELIVEKPEIMESIECFDENIINDRYIMRWLVFCFARLKFKEKYSEVVDRIKSEEVFSEEIFMRELAQFNARKTAEKKIIKLVKNKDKIQAIKEKIPKKEETFRDIMVLGHDAEKMYRSIEGCSYKEVYSSIASEKNYKSAYVKKAHHLYREVLKAYPNFEWNNLSSIHADVISLNMSEL